MTIKFDHKAFVFCGALCEHLATVCTSSKCTASQMLQQSNRQSKRMALQRGLM